MSFNVALTGLNAANQDLSVTANNLANVGTVGFKGSRAEFGDLFSATQTGVSSTAVGNGASITEVAQQFSQGDIETTGNNLDLAISGNGFFTTSNNGALEYTRDGQFQVNSVGDVVTASGAKLQVYPPLANGTFNTGGLANLSLSTQEGAPNATTAVSLTANLPASATVPADAAVHADRRQQLQQHYFRHGVRLLGCGAYRIAVLHQGGANNWNTQLYVDGNAVGTPQALTYSSSGALQTPAGGIVTFPAYTPATGAADLNMTFNFNKTTQYGNQFGVTAVTQDGYTTGLLSGISIDNAGVVQAQYTNGRSVDLGQVAMANFANPQGLAQLGDASWAATSASGSAVAGRCRRLRLRQDLLRLPGAVQRRHHDIASRQ